MQRFSQFKLLTFKNFPQATVKHKFQCELCNTLRQSKVASGNITGHHFHFSSYVRHKDQYLQYEVQTALNFATLDTDQIIIILIL
jgi:hypothetical protein